MGSVRMQRVCAWCGPAFVVVFFTGMLVAGFIPPKSPGDTPAQVAAFYRENTTAIRTGLLLMMVSAGFTIPFAAAISVQMRRAEGAFAPLAYTQLVGGAVGAVAILVPVLMFTAAAFRPGRSAEITQAINDLAMIPFVINFPPAVVQSLAIAGVALGAREGEGPVVFPRWVGWYNLLTVVGFLPAAFAVFNKKGPFAWNGLLSFWLAAVMFGGWFLIMSFVTHQAITRQEREQEQSAREPLVAQPA